jgi:DNA-binding PadR family transcriptional regulator
MSAEKSEVQQGILGRMILETLHPSGSEHGFRIANRIEQVSEDALSLNDGTVYTWLLRLQEQGRVAAKWDVSKNNGKSEELLQNQDAHKATRDRDRELGGYPSSLLVCCAFQGER